MSTIRSRSAASTGASIIGRSRRSARLRSDPASQLPVHRAGRLEHPHELVEVEIRPEGPTRGPICGSSLTRSVYGRAPWDDRGDRCRRTPRPAPASPLDAMDGLTRVVGLDVREPARRVRRFEFHRVDVASSDLKALLDGVETIVHLAGVDSRLVPTPRCSRTSTSKALVGCSTRRRPSACGASCRPRARRSTARGRTTRSRSPRMPRCARTRGSSPRCTTRRTSAGSASGAGGTLRRRQRRCAWRRWSGRVRTASSRAPPRPAAGVGAGRVAADPGRPRRRRGRRARTRRHQRPRRRLQRRRRRLGVEGGAARSRRQRPAGAPRRPRAPDAAGALVERARRRTPEVLPYLVHPWVVANDRLRRGLGAGPLERVGDPGFATAGFAAVGPPSRCGHRRGGRVYGGCGIRRRAGCASPQGQAGAPVRCVSRHSCQSGVK